MWGDEADPNGVGLDTDGNDKRMSDNSTEHTRNAELWLRARHAYAAGPRSEPNEADLLLAGYLDASLGENDRERTEAWLASDPEALDRLMVLRAELAAPRPVPPRALIERARGLVRTEGRAPSRGGFGGLLAGLFQPMAVATAAALLVACAVGFQIGRSGYESIAAEPSALEDGGFGEDDGFGGDGGFGFEPGGDDLL